MSQLGHPGLVEQPREREHIPGRGWRTVRTWHGSEQACEGFASQLIQSGYRIRMGKVEGITFEIEATIPDAQDGTAPPADPDSQQTVTWELVGNDLNKDIFNRPDFTILLDHDQSTLRKLRDGRLQFDSEEATDLTDYPGSGFYPTRFRELLRKGVQSYPVSQYVLRRSALVPIDWNGQFVMDNVGKVFTSTSQLESVEGVPASLKFAMPSGAWLKRTPTVRQQRDGRWQASNEWWHADEWSEALYDEVT